MTISIPLVVILGAVVFVACTALHCSVVRSTTDEEGDMVTENYSLRLDADRRRKLQDIATKQDRDLAYVIRKAIDEYIERHGDERDGV